MQQQYQNKRKVNYVQGILLLIRPSIQWKKEKHKRETAN